MPESPLYPALQRLSKVNPLLAQIQALEVELHHPGAPCSPERLEQLLHPDFHEVGRSGAAYGRDTVIRFLASNQHPPNVVSDQFSLAEMAPMVVLLTYRSVQKDPSQGSVNHTLRSSVWVHSGHTWQLRYHQGTPAANPW
ncbi:MAG: nuclear transport factor 2 family protein [Burkholderiaceae bacterium]